MSDKKPTNASIRRALTILKKSSIATEFTVRSVTTDVTFTVINELLSPKK